MGVSAPLCNNVDIDNFSILYSARAEQFSQIFQNVFHRTSAKYLDTSVLSAGVPLQKASFTFCLLSTVSEGEADKTLFFYKYFFPRVAEFHSWSSLLDYGLLFGDILQHNFHFYINDSFLSKLTILTSFSQKKKQTNKQ